MTATAKKSERRSALLTLPVGMAADGDITSLIESLGMTPAEVLNRLADQYATAVGRLRKLAGSVGDRHVRMEAKYSDLRLTADAKLVERRVKDGLVTEDDE